MPKSLLMAMATRTVLFSKPILKVLDNKRNGLPKIAKRRGDLFATGNKVLVPIFVKEVTRRLLVIGPLQSV